MSRDQDTEDRTFPVVFAWGLVLVAALGLGLWYLLRAEETEPAGPPLPDAGDEAATIDPMVDPPPEPSIGPVSAGIASFEAKVAARLARDTVPVEPITDEFRIEIRDVEWEDPDGQTFLQLRTLAGRVDGNALRTGRLVVHGLVIDGPEVRLEQRPGETSWNVERALGQLLQGEDRSDAAPAEPRVELIDTRIREGRIEVSPPGPGSYLFANVEAGIGRAVFGGANPPEVFVTHLTTTATLTDPAMTREFALQGARFLLPDGAVDFDIARARVGGSVLQGAVGRWAMDAPGLGLEAELRVDPLLAADARVFFPDLPDGLARFDLRIEPLPAARTALRFRNTELLAGESAVSGAFDLAIGGSEGPEILAVDAELDPLALALIEGVSGPLPYGGEVRGSIEGTAAALRFDLVATLMAPTVPDPFTVDLAGEAGLVEGALALNHLDLEVRRLPLVALRPLVPQLPLAGVVTGRATLRGAPGESPVALDVLLELEQGSLTLAGAIDLRGAAPSYDLSGRLIGVDLQSLLEPEVPPLVLDADYTVAGSGIDLSQAVASLRVDGQLTGWETAPTDSVIVRAAFDRGTLALEPLSVEAGPVALEATGTWRFVDPPLGGLDYEITIADVDAVAPYIPALAEADVEGALETDGRVSGALDAPRLAGTLSGAQLRYGDWSAAGLAARYDLTLGDTIEEARSRLVARELRSPDGSLWPRATADVDFRRPFFTARIDAERIGDGRFEFAARGRAEDGAGFANVQQLRLDAEEQEWTLARPAQLAWDPDGFDIRALRIQRVDAEGLVAIDGRLPPALPTELRIQVEALSVADVLRLAGVDPIVSGDLWLDARAIGAEDDPVVDAEFRLRDASVSDLDVGRLDGTLQYAAESLTAQADAVFDSVQTAELRATVPMSLTLGFPPGFELFEDRPWRVSLDTDTLFLDVLAEFTPHIREAEGLLHASVEVGGTPSRPLLTGGLQLWDGALTVPALNQRYEQVRADVVLDGSTATIRELRARSDGWAVATGTVDFADSDPPILDVTLDLDEFRAVGVDDFRDAAAWGTLRVEGSVRTPTIAGNVRLDDGNIEVPETADGGLELDGDGSDPLLDPLLPETNDGLEAPEASWLDRVALADVTVEAGEDLWVVTDELRAQISGELLLAKDGTDFRVFGELEGDQGTFTLQLGPIARRFDIVEARVQFFGSPDPDPALDVTASRVVPGAGERRIEILLNVSGTLDAPEVSFSTADGAAIPESEILSVLIFGQPSFALSDAVLPNEDLLVETLFGVGGVGELAALELEEFLLTGIGLPLDFIQFRPVPGSLIGAPALVFGSEIADDLFLTVDAGLTNFVGPTQAGTDAWTITLEWRIDPEWNLVVGVAPVSQGTVLRGLGTALPAVTPSQQLIVELRRRWTY